MKTFIKIIKRLLITVFALLVLFITLAYVFQDKIIAFFIQEANKDLNTSIKYDKIELSLFKNFPQVSIMVKNATLMETPKGSTDTLANIERVYLAFDIWDAIQGDFSLRKCNIENARIHMIIDSTGQRNFDIIKQDTSATEASTLSLDLKKVSLSNIHYTFENQMTHQVYDAFTPELSAKIGLRNDYTSITTQGELFVYAIQLGHDSERYFENKDVHINSTLTIRNDSSKVVIEPSVLTVEASEFDVSGYVGIGDQHAIDIDMVGRNANIQTILSILSANIYNKVSKYQSEGEVYFNAKISGKSTAPHINADFGFKNLSFFYPEMKEKITHASLNGNYNNGKENNTHTSVLSLKNFGGVLGGKNFSGALTMTNFSNPYLDFEFKGLLYLKSLLDMFPNAPVKDPSGQLVCDVSGKGLLEDFKNNTHKTQISGSAELIDIELMSTTTNHRFHGFNGRLVTEKADVKIEDLSGSIGSSDIHLNGMIRKFTNWLFGKDKPLIIENAILTSELIDLDEILSERDTTSTPTEEYRLVLPEKLQVSHINTKIQRVKFDRASYGSEYKNLSCLMNYNDKVLSFKNLNIGVAGGTLSLKTGKINGQDRDNIIVNTSAQLKGVMADSLFYLSRNFKQDFLTYQNLKGKVSGTINARLVYNSKLELQHEKINIDNELSIVGGELNNFKPLMDLYDYINEMSEKNLFTRALGLRAYKFFKTDNPNINSFQHLKFKSVNMNQINIRNYVVDVPVVSLETSAGDLKIFGNQNYGNDQIEYYIDVQLKNYHKINKNRDRAAQFGKVEKDKSKGIWLFYKITGTTVNYIPGIDKKRMFRKKPKEKSPEPQYITPSFEEGEYMEDDVPID